MAEIKWEMHREIRRQAQAVLPLRKREQKQIYFFIEMMLPWEKCKTCPGRCNTLKGPPIKRQLQSWCYAACKQEASIAHSDTVQTAQVTKVSNRWQRETEFTFHWTPHREQIIQMLVTDLEKRSYWRWKERKSQEVVKHRNARFPLWLWEGFLFGSWCEKARLRQGCSLPQRSYTSELKGEDTRKSGWCQRALQKGYSHEVSSTSVCTERSYRPSCYQSAGRLDPGPHQLSWGTLLQGRSPADSERAGNVAVLLPWKTGCQKGILVGNGLGETISSAPGSTGERRWKAVCQPEPRGTCEWLEWAPDGEKMGWFHPVMGVWSLQHLAPPLHQQHQTPADTDMKQGMAWGFCYLSQKIPAGVTDFSEKT